MRNVIRGVIFDLDGLMIDSEWISLRVWRKQLAEYGVDLPTDQYNALIGIDVEGCATRLVELKHLTVDRQELIARHRAGLIETVRAGVPAQPGVIELVTDLKQRRLPIGIASNSPCDYIDAALGSIGLRGVFDCVLSSQDVARSKPAPDVYLAAAACLGLQPSECLALEDSAVGLRAAHDAGMMCVLVPSPGQDLDSIDFPYVRFPSLTALTGDALEALLAGRARVDPNQPGRL